jgi:hypothetical protein
MAIAMPVIFLNLGLFERGREPSTRYLQTLVGVAGGKDIALLATNVLRHSLLHDASDKDGLTLFPLCQPIPPRGNRVMTSLGASLLLISKANDGWNLGLVFRWKLIGTNLTVGAT